MYPINSEALVSKWKSWYTSDVYGIHNNRFRKHNGMSKPCDLMSMNVAKLLVSEMKTYVLSEMVLPDEFHGVISEDSVGRIVENTLAYGQTLLAILNDHNEYGKSVIIFNAMQLSQNVDTNGREFLTATNSTDRTAINFYDIYDDAGVWMHTRVDVWDRNHNRKLSSDEYSDMKPYILFNLDNDLQYPYGKALFADALSSLKTLDLKYTNLHREFVLGAPRVVTSKEALRVEEVKPTKAELEANPNAKPKFRQYLGEDDEVFTVINRPTGVDTQQDIPIKQIEFALREQSFINAINFDLSIAGKHCGYDNGFFKFDGSGVAKTATEVLSAKSDLYKNIRTYQTKVANLLSDIAFMFELRMGKVTGDNVETSELIQPEDIQFGDSVIIDDNARRLEGNALFDRQAIDAFELLTTYYGYTDDEALAIGERMAKERANNPTLTGLEDFSLSVL